MWVVLLKIADLSGSLAAIIGWNINHFWYSDLRGRIYD